MILDGNVINESLSNMGFNQGWLNAQLENIGVTLDNVFNSSSRFQRRTLCGSFR